VTTTSTLDQSVDSTAGRCDPAPARSHDGRRRGTATVRRTGRKPQAARGPRIKPLHHGEDPRFDSRAACGLGASQLFDERERGEPLHDYLRRLEQAKAVCRDCPVQAGCLDYGVKNELRGFFGGAELDKGQVLEPNRKQRR
jgi:hypothetical protein